MAIETERIEITLAGGGRMGGYLARPEGKGPHPATGDLCDYRTVDTKISADERHFEMFVMTPDGEMPMFKYVYTRT